MSGMHEWQSVIRQIAAQVVSGVRQIKLGLSTSVDQTNMAIKAQYQPEGIESGFLPFMTPLAGVGWGLIAIPPAGVQIVIGHEGGDGQAGVGLGCLWDNAHMPPATYKPGEIWLVSMGGSTAKVTNDGKVTLTDAHGSSIVLNNDGTITSSGTWTHTGAFTATGEGTFNGGHTVSAHKHGGVQAGSSQTSTPTG